MLMCNLETTRNIQHGVLCVVNVGSDTLLSSPKHSPYYVDLSNILGLKRVELETLHVVYMIPATVPGQCPLRLCLTDYPNFAVFKLGDVLVRYPYNRQNYWHDKLSHGQNIELRGM